MNFEIQPASWYPVTPALNGLFVPFDDGTSVQLYDGDTEKGAAIATGVPVERIIPAEGFAMSRDLALR